MADFYIMAEDKDWHNLISEILQTGARIIPACKYNQPEYDVIESFDKFKSCYNDERLFYICHDSWEAEPLDMDELEYDNGEKKYYIIQKQGGPVIDLFITWEISEHGNNYIGTGFLSYYSKYWSPGFDRYMKPPEELKKLYGRLIKQFKKNAVCLKGDYKKYWVKSSSYKKIQDGVLSIAIEF